MSVHTPFTRATAMIAVVSTTAWEGGSAEHAGAYILPLMAHQPGVIISATHEIFGLVVPILSKMSL